MGNKEERDVEDILSDFVRRIDAQEGHGIDRIEADYEAFERLAALFAWVHGRPPSSDIEAFHWGAQDTDANLIALGFENRAGFQYNYDICLIVEQRGRTKDKLN